jgi:serine/threonine protein kinase
VNRDVADLFQKLADLTPAQREIYFLEQRVPSDVRSQVESLLAYDLGHEHLLTEPVAEWAEQLLQKAAGPQDQTRRGPLLRLQDMMNLASLTGVVLDGKYRIERQLGKGGMGAVFHAIHLGTTRAVAVKVIVPQLAGQDEFLLRFQREAEAAGRLRHPNVVNVTDFGST